MDIIKLSFRQNQYTIVLLFPERHGNTNIMIVCMNEYEYSLKLVRQINNDNYAY